MAQLSVFALPPSGPKHVAAPLVTVRRLSAADSESLLQHLRRLSPDDRASRFATGGVTDDGVQEYVSRVQFDSDLVLGCFDAEGLLVGFAHGCVFAASQGRCVEAAFSVDHQWQRQGIGTRLMREMQCRAPALLVDVLLASCSARNRAMRRIFVTAGMQLTQIDDDIEACERLPGRIDRLSNEHVPVLH